VTLELHRHEVVGLIGPNGAGKTTLVNVLTGFDSPTSGTVQLAGEEVTSWTPHRRGRAGLARTFQHSRSFAALSVRENVEVAALGSGVRPRAARERAARLLELLGLQEHVAQPAGSLAHGDERKLGVARALATQPHFLLLDEPAAGLSESESQELVHLVRRLAREWGIAVLLVEHDMSFVMNVCDRIYVIDFGERISEGTPEQVQRDPVVIAAYLGEAADASAAEPAPSEA
jgi:branched-chain amino acid transport system ATP-binding protein